MMFPFLGGCFLFFFVDEGVLAQPSLLINSSRVSKVDQLEYQARKNTCGDCPFQ